MPKKILLPLLIILFILSLVNSAALYLNYRQDSKTVVIDIMRVVNEFKLKKDLESRVAVKLNDYATELDSLKAVYKVLVSNRAQEEQIAHASAAIDTMQGKMQRAYAISNKNINEQIWQRLNALLDDYGEQYGYELVIGANGMGTVLYNKKNLDKTDELIRFINEKYETGR